MCEMRNITVRLCSVSLMNGTLFKLMLNGLALIEQNVNPLTAAPEITGTISTPLKADMRICVLLQNSVRYVWIHFKRSLLVLFNLVHLLSL